MSQTVRFEDLTTMSPEDQRKALNVLRRTVLSESRKRSYPNHMKDYHFSFISNRVVNPIQNMVEYLAQAKIKDSDLVIIGKDYDGIFILASIGYLTIQDWKDHA